MANLPQHHHGEPQVRRRNRRDTDESLWGDSNDGVWLTAERDRAADRVRVLAKRAALIAMAKDYDGVPTGCSVIFQRQCSPVQGLHAEGGEVVPGDDLSEPRLAAVDSIDAGGDIGVGDQLLEHVAPVTVFDVVKVRENVRLAAVL